MKHKILAMILSLLSFQALAEPVVYDFSGLSGSLSPSFEDLEPVTPVQRDHQFAPVEFSNLAKRCSQGARGETCLQVRRGLLLTISCPTQGGPWCVRHKRPKRQ